MPLLFEAPTGNTLAKIHADHLSLERDHSRRMKIGILGTRGIPNAYGGFEQFAQYLSLGLVQRGHEVCVYNSSYHPYKERRWEGIDIIHCTDWEKRLGSAGQFVYDYNCLKDARTRDFDVLLQLGYTSNSIWHRLWPKRALNVVNMDGLEWKRSKYGRFTKKFLFLAEKWAARHGDILVADSLHIQEYLEEKYQLPVSYIPYGAEIPPYYDSKRLDRWGLKPDGYFLAMARMEPENNIEMIIRGWQASGKKKPLVVIGNADNAFGQRLRKAYQDEQLLFIGAIYDSEVVNALRHGSAVYFHGHSVGGTNPSLLEAMACHCLIMAHDNSFNKEILGKDGCYFSSEKDIASLLERLPDQKVVTGWKQTNAAKIRNRYNWDSVVECYQHLFWENVRVRRESLAFVNQGHL